MGVIKADAYGHGIIEVAKEIEGFCDFFGVAVIEEAIELRKAGFDTPILILGKTDPYYSPLLVKYDIRPTIFNFDDAKALLTKLIKDNKGEEFGNFYGVIGVLMGQMAEDGFFDMIGLTQITENLNQTKKTPKKQQDHKKNA